MKTADEVNSASKLSRLGVLRWMQNLLRIEADVKQKSEPIREATWGQATMA
jgi:hypothetical protein